MSFAAARRAAGAPRRGPRNLHCVMGPVRHHLRRRRGGGEAAVSWARSPVLYRALPGAARAVGAAAAGWVRGLCTGAVAVATVPLGAGGGRERDRDRGRGRAGRPGAGGGRAKLPALPAAAILSKEENVLDTWGTSFTPVLRRSWWQWLYFFHFSTKSCPSSLAQAWELPFLRHQLRK